MAIVIIGGLVTSTLLNLFVLPALYLRVGGGRRAMPVGAGDGGGPEGLVPSAVALPQEEVEEILERPADEPAAVPGRRFVRRQPDGAPAEDETAPAGAEARGARGTKSP